MINAHVHVIFQYSDDDKWQIDRDKLTLEKTLGEGEFGLVVKGVLATGPDEGDFKHVAVKMLKRKNHSNFLVRDCCCLYRFLS